MSITIRSSQKLFTEAEVSGLTGICPDHLRTLALCKHLGFLSKAAFTSSDLMVVLALQPRCQH
jgi:hypothetical protein